MGPTAVTVMTARHGFGDSPAYGDRAAYKRLMRTTQTRSRDSHWDWAPLLVVGLMAGFLAPILAGPGSSWASTIGFVGLVLLLTSAVRWTRGTRRTSASSTPQERVSESFSGHA
jgi:hypothetical protein